MLGALGITLLLAAVITPSFDQLGARAIAAHGERARAALAEHASKVQSAVKDYGDWSDSYDYIAAPNARFEQESFSPLAMSNLDVNGMAYVRPDRRVVIARWYDEERASRADLRAALEAAIARTDLERVLGRQAAVAFYARLGDVVAAVGVARIRRSDGTGRPRGYYRKFGINRIELRELGNSGMIPGLTKSSW